MAWTAPRTWVHAEVPTHTQMNEQLRDNLLVLKAARDDFGRISALSSSTLTDLSAANVTGLARPAGANSFAGGATSFDGTSRLVLPVGADKYDGAPLNKTAGSLWVEGDYLHHVDEGQDEWRYLGTLVGSPAGSVVGSFWVEGDDAHYIDESGEERSVIGTSAAFHTDTAARAGSTWVEGDFEHWIAESAGREYQGHADVDHTDHSDHVDTTVPHVDHTDHTDHDDHTDHSDHVDHTDGPGHADVDYHSDATPHTDTTVPHDDHTDHTDGTPHSDVAEDKRPVLVGP